MLDLAFLALLLACSLGIGLRLLDLLHTRPEHPTDAMALAVAAGLGAIGLVVFALGQVGRMTGPAIVAVISFGVLLSFHYLGEVGWVSAAQPTSGRRLLVGCAALTHPTKRLLYIKIPTGIDLAFGLALAAGVLGSLVTALAPVTDGDALCYHLQVPKIFLARHALVFEPDLHETVYPLLTELLYAVGLAMRGPVACRLVSWLLGLVFAANVTAIARPVLGERASWAGTIAFLVPAVSNGMSAPLNDVALAAFGTAALHAWFRWFGQPSLRAATLTGFLAGLSLGVKYPAVIWTGLLGLASITATTWPRVPSRDGGARKLSHVLAFGSMALLVGGLWYVRAYVYTGNPVHPFFRTTFGGAGIDDVLDPIKRPLAPTVWNLLTALAPMTLDPDRFDSFAHQFGPVFLLFLPGLIFFRPPRQVVGLVVLAWAFLTICLSFRQSMRFVLLAVGPMAVGVAWLASSWWERRTVASRTLVALLLGTILFESSIAMGRARNGLTVVCGRESAEAYLSRREPTWIVGKWIDQGLSVDAKLIGQDHRGFYLPRPYTMELAHRRRTGLGSRGESEGDILTHFRNEGFTHILFCPPVPETAVEFDPTLSRKLAAWREARRPLWSADLSDGDGVVRRYAIYAIDDQPPSMLTDAGRTRQ